MGIRIGVMFVLWLVGCGDMSEKKDSFPETDKRAPIDIQPLPDTEDPTRHANDASASETSDLEHLDENSEDIVEIDIEEVTPREPCVLEETTLPKRYTIESVTQLLNLLPRPVTIPCLLDVLPRPLKLNATSSELSIQPARGVSSPRIFLSLNSLIITFALDGKGNETLEFSEYVGNNLSVKGELVFPISEELADDAAFTQIRQASGTGTTCAGCHFQESPADDRFPASAYASLAVRPFERQNITLDRLETFMSECDDAQNERCHRLKSLYNGGVPESYSFPLSLPTLF